jgi:hypothetical protein
MKAATLSIIANSKRVRDVGQEFIVFLNGRLPVHGDDWFILAP